MTTDLRQPFVGRTRELAILEASAAAGELCLVGGEPGIGKTRLVEAFTEVLRGAGRRVIWARCWDFGGGSPFWPFAQLVRQLAEDLDDAELRAAAGHGARSLGALIPELSDRIAEEPAAARDVEQARFDAMNSITQFLERCAARAPLVAVLDDLHGADEASLELVRFVRRAAPPGLAMIATYRTVDARTTPGAASRLADLAREARVIALRGLPEEDIAELVRQRGDGDPARAHQVFAATAGNPLLVDGALRAGAGMPLSDDVHAAIAARVERLGDGARAIVAAAAVLARPSSIAVLHATTGGELVGVLGGVDEARGAGLLVEQGDRFAFFHPVVREVAYAALSLVDRTQLHARAYTALDRLYGSGRQHHLAELARHALAAHGAGLLERGAADALAASEHALEIGAFEDAVLHAEHVCEHAHDLTDALRLRALAALGEARLVAGRTAEARAAFEELIAAARSAGAAEALGSAAIGLARTYEFGISEPRRIAALEEALALLGDVDAPITARALARLGTDLWQDAAAKTRRDEATARAIAMARRLGDPVVLCDTLAARLLAVWGPEHVAERLALTSELEQLAARTGRRDRLIEAYRFRINALVEAGDLAGAEAAIAGYAEVAQSLGRPLLLANAAMRAFFPAMARGDLPRAIALGEACRDAQVRAGDPQAEIVHVSRRILIAERQGDVATVRALSPAMVRFVEARSGLLLYRAILVRTHLAAGDRDAARAQLDRCFARDLGDVGHDMMAPSTLALLVPAAIALDDRPRVERLHDRLAPYAGLYAAIGASFPLGAVAYYLGACAAYLGRSREAADHYAAALALEERAGTAGAATVRAALEQLGAPVSVAPAPALTRSAVLRRSGAQWQVGLGGAATWIPHARGLTYLASLLARPRDDIAALELAGLDDQERGAVDRTEEPRVDAKALAAYRARAADLREQLDDAEARGDRGRADSAREALEELTEHVARDTGLRDRSRRTSGPAERARIAVTKAIARAIAAIARADAALAAHLELAIRTGVVCGYHPDPTAEITWDLRDVTT